MLQVSSETKEEGNIMADKTFTEALNDLQNAAAQIGKQATTLEESLSLFEQGMKEAEFCKEILDKADQKIRVYEKEAADAEL